MASEPHRRDAASPQAVPAVEFAGVTVSLDGRWILEDVSFSVAPGRILALLGGDGPPQQTDDLADRHRRRIGIAGRVTKA